MRVEPYQDERSHAGCRERAVGSRLNEQCGRGACFDVMIGRLVLGRETAVTRSLTSPWALTPEGRRHGCADARFALVVRKSGPMGPRAGPRPQQQRGRVRPEIVQLLAERKPAVRTRHPPRVVWSPQCAETAPALIKKGWLR